jgi:serine/threonine-protein kinase HipA
MKVAKVFVQKKLVGFLIEVKRRGPYRFGYDPDYAGPPVSLTMPVATRRFAYERFPPFFDGLLPEGPQLEGMLRTNKIDRDDYFSQLIAVGADMVGAVTVMEVASHELPDHLR